MEKTVNANVVICIEDIKSVTGIGDHYEIYAKTMDGDKVRIIFDHTVMIHCTIEDGGLNRWPSFEHCEQESSSILQIENSRTMKQFEQQSQGNYPLDGLKEYLVYDEIDTFIEVLTYDEPRLVKCS